MRLFYLDLYFKHFEVNSRNKIQGYLVLGLLSYFMICCNSKDNFNTLHINQVHDSLDHAILSIKKQELNEDAKALSYKVIFNKIKRLTSDSLKSIFYLKIANNTISLSDSSVFKKANAKTVEFSRMLKDTLKLAEAHWNFGIYFVNKEKMDSAFYHYYQAYNYYNSVGHEYYSGKMLFNMAYIQGRTKDYIGSETSTFQAISIFKKLNKNLNLYKCYNHLVLVTTELEEYNKAILYNKIAQNYIAKIKDKGVYKEGSLNNLSLVYSRQGQFDKALDLLNEALSNKNLIKEDNDLYARLIDNRAYYKMQLNDTIGVKNDLTDAFEIRKLKNNISGIVLSKSRLAEYFLLVGDTTHSISCLKSADSITDFNKNLRDKLNILKLLAVADNENASQYLSSYINLNDSLIKEERILRDKFARVKFETNQIIERVEKLSKQKKLILFISIVALLIIILVYYIKVQNSRNKELIFESEQKKSNEEIYSLMLKHQIKYEEGITDERNRISEELHDTIVGKLFGLRMGFSFLKMDKNELPEIHSKLKFYTEEIQHIERKIRSISHNLQNTEFSSNNFITLVRKLINEKSKIGKFNAIIICDEHIYWNDICEDIKMNLYRILEEITQNIIKHSKASEVRIAFKLENSNLILDINDNGVGFVDKKFKKGIGFKNIKSRVKSLKGKVHIKSKINEGTSINIIIQLKK